MSRAETAGNRSLIAGVISIAMHLSVGLLLFGNRTLMDGKSVAPSPSDQPFATVYLIKNTEQPPWAHRDEETSAPLGVGSLEIPEVPIVSAIEKVETSVSVEPGKSDAAAEPSESSPPKGPLYYHVNELSTPPTIVIPPHNIVPDGDDSRIVGAARLRILISDTGSVDNVLVDESTLPEDYALQIRNAWLQATYSPGRIDGGAVRSQVEVEIHFANEASRPLH